MINRNAFRIELNEKYIILNQTILGHMQRPNREDYINLHERLLDRDISRVIQFTTGWFKLPTGFYVDTLDRTLTDAHAAVEEAVQQVWGLDHTEIFSLAWSEGLGVGLKPFKSV